jgi:5'-phosphate synthase pdxT subunit
VEAAEVRNTSALESIGGIVLPGGESTTLLRLSREYGFDVALPRFVREGGAVFATCAGAILIARTVLSPSQWSLGLIDIDVERNGYGRQIDSFETRLTDVAKEILQPIRPRVGDLPGPPPAAMGEIGPSSAAPGDISPAAEAAGSIPAVFIRAPRIHRVGRAVQVLALRDAEPVLVLEGRLMASTFHPELTDDTRVHRYFLNLVENRPGAAS